MNNVKDEVRRRLLKAIVYSPPVILGVAISTEAGAATVDCGRFGMITISSGTNACCPCVKRPKGQKCKDAKCFLGNCVQCRKRWRKKSDCQKQEAACGCKCKKKRGRWRCK